MMGMGMSQMGRMSMGMGRRMVAEVVDDLRGGKNKHKNPAKYSRNLGHAVVTSLTDQTTTTLVVSTATSHADSHDFTVLVPFLAFLDGNSGAVTCSDSLGNTYTELGSVVFNTDYTLQLFYCTGITTVSKNAVITVTHPGSKRRVIMGDEFKNLDQDDAADQTAEGHNSVAAQFATSGMTAVTAQDKELLYGVIGVNGPSTDSLRKPSNWTLLHDRGTNASDDHDIRLITMFRTVGSTGSYEVSATLGTARLWGSITQTLKAEGGASDISKD